MIEQHASLIERKVVVCTQVLLHLGFSEINTGSKLHMQCQEV